MANVPAQNRGLHPMAHNPVNTILDKAGDWRGATSGEFNPGSVFCGLFGKEPMPHVARAGCLAAFGSPTPRALRIWKWTDYILDTSLPGFYIEVRLNTPDGHGRRFGYVIEPGLEERMHQERRELWTQTGRWFDNDQMEPGTLCRTAHDAMVEVLQAVGGTCGSRRPGEVEDDFSKTVTLWRPV
jgi:hypothetical protein